MKAWLPILVEELKAGNSPILVLSSIRNLARAAVFNGQGQLLAGSLGSPGLLNLGADQSAKMAPGQCLLLKQESNLILERLDSSNAACLNFWKSGLDNYGEAWGSWLLTMPHISDIGELSLPRHLLSAFGPWTMPRLPEEFKDLWTLLPLKAGLGRLFVIGDDSLAMESAALAARAGLTVTWYTCADQQGPELNEAMTMADFQLIKLDDWQQLDKNFFDRHGFTEGIRVLITCGDNEKFLNLLKNYKPAYLALSGEAEIEGSPAGLFPNPLSSSQKALGLVAQMLL